MNDDIVLRQQERREAVRKAHYYFMENILKANGYDSMADAIAQANKCAAMVGALEKIKARPTSGLRYDDYGYPWHAERNCTVCDMADEIAKEALSQLPARAVVMGKVDPCEDNSGRAIIEDGAIVIRLPIANLPQVVEGAWAGGNLRPRLKVTDAQVFAKELCRALNDEEEDGTTRIHLMFDASIEFASEQGFEGIEEHEEQES
jgi:hypothetical protein